MKDFDFDELDRAVNSVLAKKEPSDTPGTDAHTDSESATSDSNVPVTLNNDTQNDDNVTTTSDVEDTSGSVTVSVNNSPESSDDTLTDDAAETVPETQQNMQEVSSEENTGTSPESESLSDPQPFELNTDSSAEPVMDESEQHDNNTDEPSSDEQSISQPAEESAATSLASIPVKRGRFMDVMAPQNGDAKKPLAPRGGIKLTPSSDFSSSMTPDEASSEESTQPDTTSADKTETSSGLNSAQDDQGPGEPTIESDVSSMDTTVSDTDDTAATGEQTITEQSDATPFIADVPVEKRPLNSLSPDTQSTLEPAREDSQPEPTEPVSDQVSVDPTLTANVPKEFDKDIMAVEANETVGESDETHAEASDLSAESTTDTTNSVAMAATTAEPHPMFDTSTLGHAGTAMHHSSKLTWTVVIASLFIVGAALGVLYFLYGQA